MLANLIDEVAVNATTDGTPWYWWTIGFAGQAIFGCRFLIQWIASERAKKSVMPVIFWYMSISGGLFLLSYAIYRGDPVFITGQAMGSIVYFRNLALIKNEREAKAAVEQAD